MALTTQSLMLDMARTMTANGKPFTLHDLMEAGQKKETDPLSRMHNHEVKEACYELLDSNQIKLDDGKVVIV